MSMDLMLVVIAVTIGVCGAALPPTPFIIDDTGSLDLRGSQLNEPITDIPDFFIAMHLDDVASLKRL